MQTTKTSTILALDVGERRVGVAAANSLARLARPLTTLERTAEFWDRLGAVIAEEAAETVVVGLPRNLSGADTAQTRSTRQFIAELEERFELPVQTQDEALTSVQAEAELKKRGKQFQKADVDALAALYILEDYLGQPHA